MLTLKFIMRIQQFCNHERLSTLADSRNNLMFCFSFFQIIWYPWWQYLTWRCYNYHKQLWNSHLCRGEATGKPWPYLTALGRQKQKSAHVRERLPVTMGSTCARRSSFPFDKQIKKETRQKNLAYTLIRMTHIDIMDLSGRFSCIIFRLFVFLNDFKRNEEMPQLKKKYAGFPQTLSKIKE